MSGKKRVRHTSEQIIKKLRDADAMLAAGKSVGEVLQALEISEATLSRWRSQYGGMKSEEASGCQPVSEVHPNGFEPLTFGSVGSRRKSYASHSWPGKTGMVLLRPPLAYYSERLQNIARIAGIFPTLREISRPTNTSANLGMSGLPELELQRMDLRLKQVAQGFDEFDELPWDSAETIAYNWMAEVGEFIVLLAKEKILDLPGLDEVVAAYERSGNMPDLRGLSARNIRVFEQVVGYKKQRGKTAPGLISCAAPSLTQVYVPYERYFWDLAAHHLAHACEVLHASVRKALVDRALDEVAPVLGEPAEQNAPQGLPLIPERDQSIRVTKSQAAVKLSPGISRKAAMKLLNEAMQDGIIRFMKVTRQAFIFDCTQIPLRRRLPADGIDPSSKQP